MLVRLLSTMLDVLYLKSNVVFVSEPTVILVFQRRTMYTRCVLINYSYLISQNERLHFCGFKIE